MKIRFVLLACCLWLIGSISATQASKIHDVARKGDLAKIKILLERNPSLVNEADEDDYTPLHIAVENNRAEVVSYLIDNGANLDALNADGFTPLQHAAYLQKTKIARLIISKSGKCDIYTAVMLGDKALVNKLLDANPKLVNTPDVNGDSPLYTAAAFGYVDIAELLLDRGSDVNLAGPQNGSPLAQAVGKGHKEMVKLFLDRGANISAKENADLLDYTMYLPDDDIAQLLISKGAKASFIYAVYSKDIAKVTSFLDANPKLCKECEVETNTPLHVAAERNATEIAKLLISRGADPNSGYPSHTPLHSAAETGSKDVAVLLIAKGAKINVPKNSNSPLHIAVKNNRNDFVLFLISKGAKVDTAGNHEDTPLMIAAQQGNKELVTLFISKKCAVNAKDEIGATPLGWAVGKGHKEVAALLTKHGGKKVTPPQYILKNGYPARICPAF